MDQTKTGIFFKTYGENRGHALLLLHGYLESSEIWNDFAVLFSDEYFVVCPDIPGHGLSAAPAGNCSMEQMAEDIISVCDHLGIGGFHVAGHSMGGYVTMALLDQYAERLDSASLIHSTCFADSEEKKINRDREIELVRNGKKELIINTNIPRLYATDNLDQMKDKVENSKNIASRTPDAGIIAALQAMKTRPDRSDVLAATRIPVLLVGGKKDNLIPFEKMEEMKTLSPRINLISLEKSGHMGFIEEKELAAGELRRFIDSNFECS